MDSPGVGGTGKGASGASTVFGNNGGIGSTNSPMLIIGAALIALAVVGFIIWMISKK